MAMKFSPAVLCLVLISTVIEAGAMPQTWLKNRHTYELRLRPAGLTLQQAQAECETDGGSLVSITSAEENAFVFGLVDQAAIHAGVWIGGYQPPASPEPGLGWTWLDGDPFVFGGWEVGEPNDGLGGPTEDAISFFTLLGTVRSTWNDVPSTILLDSYVFESPTVIWSANGNTYEARTRPAGISWTTAQNECSSEGGHLATIGSAAENDFVFGLINSPVYWNHDVAHNWDFGPWIGGIQDAGSPEPTSGWGWVTGEPMSFTHWNTNQPDNYPNLNGPNTEDRIHYFTFGNTPSNLWNDQPVGNLMRGYVFEREAIPTVATLSGSLSAACGTMAQPLFGVAVDVFAAGTDSLVASDVTDSMGGYVLVNLLNGDYEVAVSTPLGLMTDHQDSLISIAGADLMVEFDFSCLSPTARARGKGYWKHQFKEAIKRHDEPREHGEEEKERESAISDSTLCAYLDMIESHFGNNQLNSVVMYNPPVSGLCTDKIRAARGVFKKFHEDRKRRKATAELFAVLLNVAAGNLSQFGAASQEGATISQAITYCDALIDDPAGDYKLAKKIAKKLNRNKLVHDGMIPLSTSNIAYKRGGSPSASDRLLGNIPNPFNPQTMIRFRLEAAGHYEIVIYSSAGRVVDRINGSAVEGDNRVLWNAESAKVSSGVYFYSVRSGDWTASGRMVMVK